MELFAAGFNAWHQLEFQHPHSTTEGSHDPSPQTTEPRDLHSFTKVIAANTLERPVAGLSYTLVRYDGQLSIAGIGPTTDEEREFIYTSTEAATGEILAIESLSSPNASHSQRQPDHTTHLPLHKDSFHLVKYSSLDAWKSHVISASWECSAPPRQIAAYDSGFVILYDDGSVATLGDPRFEGSLGRDITPEQHAEDPCPVIDLLELDDPVKHISAGGYSVAALTESGSIYVWGTPSAGTHRRKQAFSDLLDIPNYIEIDNDKDVQDVAIGDSHAIALTTDGCLYVIGENSNGQLGLGHDTLRTESWTRLAFEPELDCKVAGVAAGPMSSFIVISRPDQQSV